MIEKILIIEDETAIADSIAYSLNAEGYETQWAADGQEAIEIFNSFSPSLILLDLMLPKLSGLDFCKIIRKESSVPIIMLTAKSEEVDIVLGLELGADDYILKPFSVREVLARVRAILRRLEAARFTEECQTILKSGEVQMDLNKRCVKVCNETVHLPLKQFELLRVLLSNKGKVVKREDLFYEVWDNDVPYDTGSLDVHMRWLREKIEIEPGRPAFIRTVRGIGYKIAESGSE